jgi:hypothetical protein
VRVSILSSASANSSGKYKFAAGLVGKKMGKRWNEKGAEAPQINF